MSSKDTIEKAYGSVPKEVTESYIWDWIPSGRGFKYYYLKIVRFFTR
jgi:hypothetical protein